MSISPPYKSMNVSVVGNQQPWITPTKQTRTKGLMN